MSLRVIFSTGCSFAGHLLFQTQPNSATLVFIFVGLLVVEISGELQALQCPSMHSEESHLGEDPVEDSGQQPHQHNFVYCVCHLY